MKPDLLTEELIRRINWVNGHRLAWQYEYPYTYKVVDGHNGNTTWEQYLRQKISSAIKRNEDKPREIEALKYIIINQLPTLMACELIEEFDL